VFKIRTFMWLSSRLQNELALLSKLPDECVFLVRSQSLFLSCFLPKRNGCQFNGYNGQIACRSYHNSKNAR